MPPEPGREQRWTIYVCPRCDQHTPVGTCGCEGESNPVPRSVVPASALAEVERELAVLRADSDRGVREIRCQVARAERAEGDVDSLIRGLATILGPARAPAGVGRIEFWIGRVGHAPGERETALERAREALEEIAATEDTWVRNPVTGERAVTLVAAVAMRTAARAALDAIPASSTKTTEERDGD